MLQTVQIISGAENKPWTKDERRCVLEIRSEHKLDDPTSFSILMHDAPDRPERSAEAGPGAVAESVASVAPGGSGNGNRPRRKLAVGHQVAVMARHEETAENNGDWDVVFLGKVSEVDTYETQGGLGSTILFKGKDIRMKMAARSYRGSWSGQVDAIMENIIKRDFPNCEVDAPENNEEADEEENPLAQNSNNLDFLRNQALAFGHHLWVSYSAVTEDGPLGGNLSAFDPTQSNIHVEPMIHWARSPFHNAKSGDLPLGGDAPALPSLGGGANEGLIEFKVHLNREACPNVTMFEVTTEGQDVQVMPNEQEAPTIPSGVPSPGDVLPGGGGDDADAPLVYFEPPEVQANDADEHVNRALETARSFKVRVKLSTTMRHLKKLCYPHDLAKLKGVDAAHEGKLFRVSEVTHVIRIDSHYMDIVLQGDGETPASSSSDDNPLSQATGAVA